MSLRALEESVRRCEAGEEQWPSAARRWAARARHPSRRPHSMRSRVIGSSLCVQWLLTPLLPALICAWNALVGGAR